MQLTSSWIAAVKSMAFCSLSALLTFSLLIASSGALAKDPPGESEVLDLASKLGGVTQVIDVEDEGRLIVVFSPEETSIPMLKIRVFACGGRCFLLAEINRVPVVEAKADLALPFTSAIVDGSLVEIRRVTGEVIMQARFK